MYNKYEINNICNHIWYYFNQNPEFHHLSYDDLMQHSFMKSLQKDLNCRKPIQYILSSADFMGLDLKVTPSVLIPRSETESLVEWILEDIPAHVPIRAVDIGTGSGCIALALKKFRPQWEIYALDCSSQALSVARENAENLDLKLTFIEADILAEWPGILEHMNLVVSNPPYIAKEEQPHMDSHVIDFEPHIALFPTGSDPLIFYRRFAEMARSFKTKPISLYLEMNALQHAAIENIFRESNIHAISLKQDLESNTRMIKVSI